MHCISSTKYNLCCFNRITNAFFYVEDEWKEIIKKMSHNKNQIRNKKTKSKGSKKDEQYFDDIIDIGEIPAKDFEFLVNAPVSEDDHFVLKSEKSWNVDVSKYSEYFTLELKTLSAAIEASPFNENVNIDAKYFTNDQLTNMYNKAERAKENYNKIVNTLDMHIVSDIKHVEENEDSIADTTDDLDFLLSLQEPANEPSTSIKQLLTSYSTDSKITANSGTSVKSMDLEKWLDSVLDD